MPEFFSAHRRALASARWLLVACAALAAAGCATVDLRDIPRTPSFAYDKPTTTTLGKAVYAEAAKHPGQSGFHLIESGIAGFAARIALIDAAEHTLDLQYYLMEGETADLVAERLLAAADRGVRVRLLVDDIGQYGRESTLAALSAHRNVQVRTFNPILLRGPGMALVALEYAVRAAQLDRRMHNKLFVADDAIALIGGRNLGDAYFDAPGPIDFQDLDVVAAGPIVRALSATFDDYWNSQYSVPVEALTAEPVTAADVAKTRARLASVRDANRDTRYGHAVAGSRIARDVAAGRFPAIWARSRVLADSPAKVDPSRDGDGTHLIADEVLPALASVKKDLIIVSPYVVPGDEALAAIDGAAKRGARVRILTNSLATTDEPLAHAGYAAARDTLLDARVELYELKPQATPFTREREHRHGPSSGSRTALHAKVQVYDRRYVFLTSMNLDQRSIHLNTEIGLWVDSTQLAAEVTRRFDEAVRPDNSYHVVHTPDGHLEWITEQDGARVTYDDEPDTTPMERLRASLARLLPIKGEL